MKKPILDPVDFYHPMYGEDDFDTNAVSSKELLPPEDPLHFLQPLDEDQNFVKLGDFWPKEDGSKVA